MAPTQRSLKTAIAPPSIPEAYIPRQTLLARMREYTERRLILIHAPAGYGKTTLVTAFSQELDQPVCWLRLTSADEDVVRLADLLRTSLTERFHRLRGRLDFQQPADATGRALATQFAEQVGAAVPEPFAIVIDDVQYINRSEPAAEFLDRLLGAMPDSVTFVISGRELPRVSLSSLVMDGEVGGIGTRELALEQQEMAELLHQRLDLDLHPPELDDLYQRTEGWITGALLFAVDPQRNASSSLLPHFEGPTSFFAEAVVDQVSDEMRGFLLESAVLPKMTAQSCNEILGRTDSEERLAEMTRRGYFITALQTEPRSYEYHPLFRESLVELLRQDDPDRLHALLNRAAKHFARQGAVEEAFDLYMAAGSEGEAGRLAETARSDLFAQGRLSTLKSWASTLHAAGVEAPNLMLTVATAACDQGEFEEAEAWLSRALAHRDEDGFEEHLLARARYVEGHLALQRGEADRAHRLGEEVESLLTPAQDNQTLRRSGALRLRAMAKYQMGDDLELADRLAERALDLLEDSDHRYTYAQALMDRGAIQTARGRVLEAYEMSQLAHRELLNFDAPLPLTISFNNLANLAHSHGRYNEAFELFEEAIKHARRAGSARYEASVLLGQGDLFNDLGLRFQAGDLYGEGLRTAAKLGLSSLMGYGYLQTCQLHRRAGNFDLATEWLEEARGQSGPYTGADTIEMHAAALQINDDPAEAARRLRELRDGAEHTFTAANNTRLLYFLALAQHAQEEERDARKTFRQAMDFASRRGTTQILAGELMHDDRLLELARRAFPDDPIVDQLESRLDFMGLVQRSHGRRDQGPDFGGATLGVVTMGSGALVFEGEQVTDLPPLPRQLLFYLVDKQPAARDRVLEAFWPDVDADRQVSSLYTAVHTIRRHLGERAIVIDGALYRINPEWSLHYDAAEFERAAGIAQSVPKGDPRRPFALAEAIHAYEGPFLPEFSGDWVLERRRELKMLLLELLTAHAEANAAAGHLDQSALSLERALSLDPLRDDLHLRYMQILAEMGRRSEVITHYHEYSRRLASELGIDPPTELRRFYEQHIA